jgi:VWFA-related protein
MDRSRTIGLSVVALGLVLTTGGLSSQQAPQAAPPFRAGVELIDLDVSVLDKDRRPVPGLTAADFTVVVDGQPRPIVAFKAVDLAPPVVAPAAPWVRQVGRDVSTNALPAGRVVVILMDDGSLNQVDKSNGASNNRPVVDQSGILKMRELARTVVDEIGPDDMAAVVYSENNHTAETFTNDRQRLLAAIENSVLMPSQTTIQSRMGGRLGAAMAQVADPQGRMRGSCVCGLCSIQAIAKVAESLRSLPHQRKVIAYVSGGVVVAPEVLDPCMAQRHEALASAFRQASLANVAVHAIDPKGLNPDTSADAFSRTEYLKTVAEQTGGRWILNNNDPERMIPAVLAESSSYYLLGVEQPGVKDDGMFHEIKVRVSRPDVEVRTRKGFYALTEKERAAMTAAAGSRDLATSIGAALPKSDIPMDVGVAAIEGPDGKSGVALVVAVRPPVVHANVARTESIELMTSAFNMETGDRVTSQGQKVDVVWNPTDAAAGVYEVISHLPLRPGRYELRLGLKGGDGRTASVYGYADVPNFGDGLTVSGLMLSSTPRPKLGAVGDTASSLPILPTARRTFSWTDEVTGWVRIYEPKGKPFVPVSVTTKITDSTNQVIATTTETLKEPRAPEADSVDYKFPVQLTALPPGEFLLRLEVATGAAKTERFLRFRVE